MVLTVTSSVSGQRSMGPTGVRLQSKARVRRAISPVPKIKFCRKVGGGVRSSFFSRNFTFTNGSCCGTRAFGSSDRFAFILCIRVNRSQVFDVFGMWDGLKVEKGCLGDGFALGCVANYLFWGAWSQRLRVGYSVWMRVCVLYFGVLKDLVGHGRSEMDLAEGASVAQLLEAHRGLVKGQESLWESIAVAVNQEYAKADVVLEEGDELALLPPVSGGLERYAG